MKLINQEVKRLNQGEGLEGIYKQIELAGRTCYKSEDKITPESAKGFVERMIASNHMAMLEHGTVYLTITLPKKAWHTGVVDKYYSNKYSRCTNTYDDYNYTYYITTNYRVLVENEWLDDLKYLTSPTDRHIKRETYRITTDRGITHELVRHRVFSFAQESTRYCNYAKDKFGNQLTFIIPEWLKERLPEGEYKYNDGSWEKDGNVAFNADVHNDRNLFLWDCNRVEDYYNKLVNEFSWKAEEARQILPTSIKSEIVMTGFEDDWDRFLELRAAQSTGKVHPNMYYVANKINTYDNEL